MGIFVLTNIVGVVVRENYIRCISTFDIRMFEIERKQVFVRLEEGEGKFETQFDFVSCLVLGARNLVVYIEEPRVFSGMHCMTYFDDTLF